MLCSNANSVSKLATKKLIQTKEEDHKTKDRCGKTKRNEAIAFDTGIDRPA
jgi:hypothetical protein